MSDALFDLGARPPTTRTIALQVRERGLDALEQAQLRADAARYQEVTCRSALNPVKGMPFKWTLNPYRGCTHACHYCFARRYHTQFELGSGDEFSSVIFVKTNFPDVLRRELDRPSWSRDMAALGTATDPYQPIEGHYRLTRRTIEALLAAKNPVGIVTKGPMIVRDADLLADLSRVAECTVCVSVPTVDEDAWRALEPGTAHPLQRLRAVRKLRDAGVKAGVLMAPVVPGFTTRKSQLDATIKAARDHEAAFLGANVMYLEGGTKDHFMRFLRDEFPDMVDGYVRLYPGAYAAPDYVKAVKGLIAVLQEKYDVNRRRRIEQPDAGNRPEPPPPSDPQSSFDW
ncbi:MAG TPA: radical SAM protein [Vicinamibacterales bacterium]|jgi:DNA repair photolyase|nr:radical SAM protein [Vicinamibacterales bacterium]